jgi:hypothetical protein
MCSHFFIAAPNKNAGGAFSRKITQLHHGRQTVYISPLESVFMFESIVSRQKKQALLRDVLSLEEGKTKRSRALPFFLAVMPESFRQ